MRVLFWLVLVLIVLAWLSRNKKKSASSSQARDASAQGAERMLQCRYCGLHIPASEALLHSSGDAFCSEEHKRLTFP